MNDFLQHKIEIFVELGVRLGSPLPQSVRDAAMAQNHWFSLSDIHYAIDAIVEQMLNRDKLTCWAAKYDFTYINRCRVGIVMAGNIPLVGFADMLYVIFAGCVPVVKLSSKDSVLMSYLLGLLKDIDASLEIDFLSDDAQLDAVIATGSDNANLYFRAQYGNVPSLFRASMYSVAVLDNSISDSELRLLSDDIYLHNGLGCRNVSHLCVSDDFDFVRLLSVLSERKDVNPHYFNNYKQHKALLTLRGDDFFDGDFFTITKGQPADNMYISNLTYSISLGELDSEYVQCVVGQGGLSFGSAQRPGLADYADNKDVMNFLLKNI